LFFYSSIFSIYKQFRRQATSNLRCDKSRYLIDTKSTSTQLWLPR